MYNYAQLHATQLDLSGTSYDTLVVYSHAAVTAGPVAMQGGDVSLYPHATLHASELVGAGDVQLYDGASSDYYLRPDVVEYNTAGDYGYYTELEWSVDYNGSVSATTLHLTGPLEASMVEVGDEHMLPPLTVCFCTRLPSICLPSSLLAGVPPRPATCHAAEPVWHGLRHACRVFPRSRHGRPGGHARRRRLALSPRDAARE